MKRKDPDRPKPVSRGCLRWLVIGAAVVVIFALIRPPSGQDIFPTLASLPSPTDALGASVATPPPLLDIAEISGFQISGDVTIINDDHHLYSFAWNADPRVMLTVAVCRRDCGAHSYQEQYPVDHGRRDMLGVSVESGFRDDFVLNGVPVTDRFESLAFDFEHAGRRFSGELTFERAATVVFDPVVLNRALTQFVAAVTGQPLAEAASLVPTRMKPDNCATAVAAGLSAAQAAQWDHLDRDRDGVACYGD